MRRHEITDRQWEVASPLLSGKATDSGVTAKDNRLFFNAVVWIMRTGCPWADLPERFGKVDTVRKRFRRLAQQGVWQRLFDALQAPELEWVMLDATVVRAHQHSAGQKNSDPATECLGRSRGGVSTNIHACVESLGNAVRLLATEGQAGDSPQALPLLADLAPGKVLADTAYDSDATRDYCAERGIEVVIPSHPNRTEPLPMDEETYRDRNKIERFFGRLKQYRRLATRYEKTVVSFLAFWHIGAALDWLR